METWEQQLKDSICSPDMLAEQLNVDSKEIARVHAEFPLRITPYYLSLIKKKGDAIWKQAVPDLQELEGTGVDDPLSEEHDSPVKCITHRYPDRVLFYASPVCAVYCRFCTRKRKVSDCRSVSNIDIQDGIRYIREHREIRDVVISGGDPFLLSDEKIEYILSSVRKIPHVQIIRFGTRTPVTLPQRITESLCYILKKYHPVFINTHFNHPDEITPESKKACQMLADSGMPLGNQSVLLKGVNDSPAIFAKLLHKLLEMRVRPYYIYQADLVKGTEHFRTPVSTGLKIIESLRGHTSGLAVPHYVIDAPDGGGKIAVIPNPVVKMTEDEILLMNYEKKIFSYPNVRTADVECVVV
jgi:lysine 2,3-aminomutase